MTAVPSQDPFGPRAPLQRSRVYLGSVVATAVGGSIGGSARYLAGEVVPSHEGAFPWDTLLVNLLGSLVLAVLLVLILEAWRPSRLLRPFLAVGVIGSFTTFGTLMVEFDQLLGRAAYGMAGGYLFASLVGGMLATYLGLLVGRSAVPYTRSRKAA